MKYRALFVTTLIFLCLFVSVNASAAQAYPALVLDLIDPAVTDTTNKAFFFPDLPTDLRTKLDQGTIQIGNAVQLVKDLVDRVPDTEDRWIATKGDVLHVYVLHGSATAVDIQFQETQRDTRFAEDLEVLKKLVAERAATVDIEKRDYRLTKVRARLTVTASTGSDDQKQTAEKTIITGPSEHLFLSADVPFNDLKQVKYDNSTHQLVSKDTPTKFFAAVDYQVGDLFLPPTGAGGIVFKALFQPSRTPLSSYGMGIGFRSSQVKIGSFELDKLTPFVAYVRSRQDTVTADGTPQKDAKLTNDFVWGLSFNLDNALAWVKKQ